MYRSRSLAVCLVLAGMGLIPQMLPGQAPPVSSNAYAARRAEVIEDLPDGLLIVPAKFDLKAEDQHNFRQRADFYYLTGLGNTPGAVLVIDGAAQRSLLFVAPLPDPVSRWVPKPSTGPVDSLALDRVLPWDSFPSYLDRRFRERPGIAVYLTDTATSQVPAGIPPIHNQAALWRGSLQQRWPGVNIRSARGVLDSLRWLKSSPEVTALRQVGAVSAQALRAAFLAVSPGRRQRSVEIAVVKACIDGGAEGPSFWPWTMSGPNAVLSGIFASFADYHHLDRTMSAGEVIRLDVGCDLLHYEGDVGRTAPVSGRFTPEQREVWELLVAAYHAGIAHMREGVSSDDVIAASVARVRELQPRLRTSLGRAAAARLLSPDGTESWELHGVGLESAENGSRPGRLRAGMVFAFEPDVLVSGQAFYLEDMILVNKDGAEVLTPGLPYTADAIERAMRR